jgi:hypothetical protein
MRGGKCPLGVVSIWSWLVMSGSSLSCGSQMKFFNDSLNIRQVDRQWISINLWIKIESSTLCSVGGFLGARTVSCPHHE